MSEDQPNRKDALHASLVAAKSAMGALVRDASNPHFKSKYATLANCIDVVVPALHAHGLVLVERLDHKYYDDINVLHLHMSVVHVESGQSVESSYPIMAKDMDNPQHLGSAITYARRYLLQTMAGLAPEDDDGNAASGHTHAKAARTQPAPSKAVDPWEAKCRAAIANPPVSARDALAVVWKSQTSWEEKHAEIAAILEKHRDGA